MTDSPASRDGRRIGIDLGVTTRALQVGIVAALVEGLRRRDPSVIVNGVLSFAFAALPRVVEHRYGLRVRPWQRLWVSAAGLVHTLGMLGPYDDVWWWDDVAHTLSSAVVGGAVDVVLQTEAENAGRSPVSARCRSATVVGVTLGLGLVWELLEYCVHALGARLGFEPLLVHYGRRDTIGDLVCDVLGAGLVVVFGRDSLSSVVDSVPESSPED